jgi:iodotyrosine deiodinase
MAEDASRAEDAPMIPLEFGRLPVHEMRQRAAQFYDHVSRRRSVRHFSDAPIPLDVVERCIAAAGTAPSGAHKQPWRFVLVTNPALKSEIRRGAEEEERAFYSGRATARWLNDLKPMGTDANKPMLEHAPALIVVFAQRYGESSDARNYYVQESVGIAVGILLSALQHAGLAALVHTPSPMQFLGRILKRPSNERPFLLIPVGYPADACRVPDLVRKPLGEIMVRDTAAADD